MEEEERTKQHKKCAAPPLLQTCEGCVDLAFGVGIEDKQLQSKRSGGLLCVFHRHSRCKAWRNNCRVSQHRNRRGVGYDFTQQGHVLSRRLAYQITEAGDIAAWSIEAGHKPSLDRVRSETEDNWYLRCVDELLHHWAGENRRGEHDDGNLLAGQFRELGW